MNFIRTMIPRLAVFAVTLLVFARLTSCSFTWWDDQATIHQNPRLNPPTWRTFAYYWTTAGEQETMALYVPVTYTVWAGLAKIGHLAHPDADGLTLNARVFHSANVLIHAITAVMVFQLLLRLFQNNTAALLGSLLFALHPVQVESVGWASGTKDLLCGLLSTAALLMYVASIQVKLSSPQHRWPSRWRYLVGLVFFVLAMLAKPTGVVTPLMAAVIALFILDQKFTKTAFSLLPWFALMMPCLIWTQKVQPATDTLYVPPWLRPAVAADAISFYLYKLAWPIHLCIDYGRNPPFIIADRSIYFTWIAPTIAAILLWIYRKTQRPLVAAGFLLMLPLVPTLGIVPFEFQIISTTSDHYLYLPMLGAAVGLAWLITRYRPVAPLACILLAALSVRTIAQEPTWQNTRTLFDHARAVNPLSVASMDGLGFVNGRDARRLVDSGRPGDARSYFEQSIYWYRKSLEYGPRSGPSLLNLALNYQAINRQDLWTAHIRAMNDLPQAPIALARQLGERGDLPGAIAWLDELIRRDPNNLTAVELRARAIQRLK